MRRIVSILSVVDTREYEEGPDGKFRPIPGSGIPSECARCGRSHEVHATVLLEDDTTALVGTGCMAKADLSRKSQVQSADRLAKRVAKLRAELQHEKALHEAYKRDREEVEKLTPPPIVEKTEWVNWAEKELPVIYMGEAKKYLQFVRTPQERRDEERYLYGSWIELRLRDLGWGWSGRGTPQYPHSTEEELERAEEKLEALMRQAC